jgi:hypothetical protein
MKLSKELEDLVDGLLNEDVVDEMADEKLHRGTLFLLDGGSFRRVALFGSEWPRRSKRSAIGGVFGREETKADEPGSRRSREGEEDADRNVERSVSSSSTRAAVHDEDQRQPHLL